MHSAMLRRETSIEITESMEDPCIDADDDIFNLNYEVMKIVFV